VPPIHRRSATDTPPTPTPTGLIPGHGEIEDHAVEIRSTANLIQEDYFFLCFDIKIDVMDPVRVQGKVIWQINWEGSVPGAAQDDDGDGLDEVSVELTALEGAENFDQAWGKIVMSLDPTRPSQGQVEERANNNLGLLDVPPYTLSGTYDLSINVFFQIEFQGHNLCLRTAQSINLTQRASDQGDFSANITNSIPLYEVPSCTGPWTHDPTKSPAFFLESMTACPSQPTGGIIHGWMWDDKNADGIQDPGEGRLVEKDWTIWVDLDDDGQMDQDQGELQKTSDGTFMFQGVQPGTYKVWQIPNPGWTQTYPAHSDAHTVKVEEGQNYFMGVSFGNYRGFTYQFKGSPTITAPAGAPFTAEYYVTLTNPEPVYRWDIAAYSSYLPGFEWFGDMIGTDVTGTKYEPIKPYKDGITSHVALSFKQPPDNSLPAGQGQKLLHITIRGTMPPVSTKATLEFRDNYFASTPLVFNQVFPNNANWFVSVKGLPKEITLQPTFEDAWDFGDAPTQNELRSLPNSYPTLLEHDGARHKIVQGGPYFGNVSSSGTGNTGEPDAENDGQPHPGAWGDDIAGIGNALPTIGDEEGVAAGWWRDDPGPHDVTVRVGNPRGGVVQAWIDWNGDGIWHPHEQVSNRHLSHGDHDIAVQAPSYTVLHPFARFRISSQGGLEPWGEAPDGEVEDHQIFLWEYDFGDAPDARYQTTYKNSGAFHIVDSQYCLGSGVDGEPHARHNAKASGDNHDDGVEFITEFLRPTGNSVSKATIEVTASHLGLIKAWIDWNQDGKWDDPQEQIMPRDMEIRDGTTSIQIDVPPGAELGETFARFRYWNGSQIEWYGAKPTVTVGGVDYGNSGEIEDYRIYIGKGGPYPPEWDFGDAPALYRDSLPKNGEPIRITPDILPSVYLGSRPPDAEGLHQPHPFAEGDDRDTDLVNIEPPDNYDDEDGVEFITPLIAGQPAQVVVVASENALLSAWIDFRANNDWSDSIDQVFHEKYVRAGKNTLTFTVPGNAAREGTTFARFRLENLITKWKHVPGSPVPEVEETIAGGYGEIEDYQIDLGSDGPYPARPLPGMQPVHGYDWGDAPDPTYPTLRANSGAHHQISLAGPWLGSSQPGSIRPDHEVDGQPDIDAQGDDRNGDDEDGLWVPSPLLRGQKGAIVTELHKDQDEAATVGVWIDLNRDGDWIDQDEFLDTRYETINKETFHHLWTFQIPANTLPGPTYIRVRAWHREVPNPLPTGLGGIGEVEDHRVEIQVRGAGGGTPGTSPPGTATPGTGTPGTGTPGTGVPTGLFISGVKFNDRNFNGTRQPSEPGVAKWRIWIDQDGDGNWYDKNGNGQYEANDGDELMVLTDTNGRFLFFGLQPGTYVVCEEQRPGWKQTAPAAGTHTVELKAGQASSPRLDFGNYQAAAPGRAHDWGDAPDGPYPTLEASGGAHHDVDTGFCLGQWVDGDFDGAPGYEAQGDDNDNVDDEDGVAFNGPLLAGQDASIDIVLAPLNRQGVLEGWIDFDRDDVWEPGEKIVDMTVGPAPAAQTIAVQVAVPANVSGVTWARFRLSDQPTGTPEGYGGVGEVEDFKLLLGPGGPFAPVAPAHQICGRKFNDRNGNGRQDAGEKGISGWIVYLDENGNRRLDPGEPQQSTGPQGDFVFTGLAERSYTVVEASRDGWTQTTPDGDGTYTVTINPLLGTPACILFGNKQTGATAFDQICGTQFNDRNGNGNQDSAEEGLPGWTIYLDQNRNGSLDADERQATTDSQGDFLFTALPEGRYYVMAEAQAGWAQTVPGGSGVHLVRILASRGVPACVAFGSQYAGAIPGKRFDWGDAPDPTYPTLSSSNGARHEILAGFHLGAEIDTEPDGRPDNSATGDDLDDQPDEDGILFLDPLLPGTSARLEITASAAGRLDAWIDFGTDGAWDQSGDRILTSRVLSQGSNSLSFTIPISAGQDQATYARFRFSSSGGLDFIGPAADGEVEDYRVWLGQDGPDGPGGEPAEDPNHLKWSQPPLEIDPDIGREPVFCAWNEACLYARPDLAEPGLSQVVVDDFRCLGAMPVTELRWWGSYLDWDAHDPPAAGPVAWRIGFWSHAPAAGFVPRGLPDELLWQVEVPARRVSQSYLSRDVFPGAGSDAGFVYELELEPQEIFWQGEFTTQDHTFWIHIMAVYAEGTVPAHAWVWKTRPQVWQDSAVTFVLDGALPEPGLKLTPYMAQPLQSDALCEEVRDYDMAFDLLTGEPWVAWDQPFTGLRNWPLYEAQASLALEDQSGGIQHLRQVADDWPCPGFGPVVALAWHGSYPAYGYEPLDCEHPPPPRAPDAFLLSLHTGHGPDQHAAFGHAGTEVWTYRAEAYEEVMVGYDRHPVGEPNEPVYRYSVRLPREHWFWAPQLQQSYWLSVTAVYREPTEDVLYDWGWTTHEHAFGDSATAEFLDGIRPAWEQIVDPTDDPADMSFTLYTCPVVTFPNYARWAEHWLRFESEADLYRDDNINFFDLGRFTEQWLDCRPHDWP